MENKNISEKDGLKTFDKGWMKKVKDIYIIHLEGNEYEMGFQYSKLLEQEIKDGALLMFSRYGELTLQHSQFGKPKILGKIVLHLLETIFRRRFARNLREEDLQFFKGMGDGLGFPDNWARWNVVITDFFMFLPALVYGKKREFMRFPPPIACSSFGSSPKSSENGHTISGHNKDFSAMEYWDKYQVLAFHKPNKGYRYVHLSGAGMPSTSIVSINECGLVFSGHVVPSNDIRYDGLPILIIGDGVMKSCNDTQSGIEYLKSINPMTGWKFHLIDKSGRLAIVEMTAHKTEYYYLDEGTSSCANVFKGETIKQKELKLSQSVMNNCLARQSRMEMLLKENYGKITVEKGISFLGDHFDIYTNTERAVGNVIAQMTNLNSVIFDHTEMKLWVADGKSPVCNTNYRGFTFECGYDGDFSSLPNDIESKYNNTNMYKSVRECIYANNYHFLDENYSEAIEHLTKAEELQPDEVLYPQIKGIILLQVGKYEEAICSFEKAKNLAIEPHKQHLAIFWIGRCYDLLNDRDKAKEHYKQITNINNVDEKLLKASIIGLRKKYKKSKLKSISLDFWSGDTYEY